MNKMILRAYKTEISVNNKQNSLLLQHLGCARFAFNWALNIKKEAFDKKDKIPNAIELHRELNKLKKTD
jgi:putative transposase